MGFTFEWADEAQRVMRYVADGEWTWRDFHAMVRASLISMHRHPHAVETLIDLRGSARAGLPAGGAAHVRTFGKRLSPALSGRAVVIGMPAADLVRLGVAESRQLPTPDGEVRFVDSDDEAAAVLAAWQA